MLLDMEIAVACGGTGGHIFPGLAVAEVLRDRGHEVTLWLGGKQVEGVSVAEWNGPVVTVCAAGFPSGVSFRSLCAAFRLLRSIGECRRRMRTHPPDVLLAMGSYASVGPVLAARGLRVPVVLHESNAVPGRAVRFLSRWAVVVALGFDEAREQIRHAHRVVTGFPLRRSLAVGASPDKAETDRFTVLVTGGSQGAHALNETAATALVRLHEAGIPLHVIHLAGSRDDVHIRDVYAKAGVSHQVYGFLKEMGAAYRVADVALTRAGAATCAELQSFALPAVLVPYPFARNDHQTANANALVRSGGALVRRQEELTVEWLCDFVASVHADPERLASMKQALRAGATVDAAATLATLVENTAGSTLST